MATGGSDVASDEISDFQCCTCSNKTAVKYCVDCQGYCCQICVDVHSRFPTLKHMMLDKTNSQATGSSAQLPSVPTEMCSIHAVKLVMYCKDHDEVGCTTCMALNHRSCKHVHSIPDDIDIIFEASGVEKIHQKAKCSKEALENINKKKDAHLAELDSSKKEADTAIEKARGEIIDLVEDLVRKSKSEVENLYERSKARIEIEREEVTRYMHDLEKVMSDMQTSERNRAQQFVCMKEAYLKDKEAKKVEASLQTETKPRVTFQMETDIQQYFRNMKTLGNVSSLIPSAERTEIYTVKNYKDMNVKLQQDSLNCEIFGSCWTRDGSLLLVDINNKKLKRADITSMSVNGFCSFDSYPYCVCCTNAQEAVVTFYGYAKYIQFVSVGNQLIPTRKIDINHHCLGIAYKEEKLYITDNAQTLYIHDMDGNELKAVSQDSSGNSLFRSSRQIAFDNYMQRIFVADWNKGVIILDEQYQLVASFSASELSGVSDVCTDRRCNIFVCGYHSHNVLQIGYDGKKGGVVADKSHGVQNPESVLFDSGNCKLILTQSSDIVKIFDLK